MFLAPFGCLLMSKTRHSQRSWNGRQVSQAINACVPHGACRLMAAATLHVTAAILVEAPHQLHSPTRQQRPPPHLTLSQQSQPAVAQPLSSQHFEGVLSLHEITHISGGQVRLWLGTRIPSSDKLLRLLSLWAWRLRLPVYLSHISVRISRVSVEQKC